MPQSDKKVSNHPVLCQLFQISFSLGRGPGNFWDVVAERARLLSSKVAVSDVADFSMVKEARAN
jgi:hypothetical protein